MVKSNPVALLLTLAMAASACKGAKPVAGGFDPQNIDQVAEIYVRSNYFKDFSLFEKYGLRDKAGLQYTDAILYYSGDTVRWQSFLKKVEARRELLAKDYPASSAP